MFEPSKDIHTNLIAIKKYCHFDEQEGVDTGVKRNLMRLIYIRGLKISRLPTAFYLSA